MKKNRLIPLMPAWIGLLLLAALTDSAHGAQRVALVIGNASYANVPELANPLNDAADVGDAFERLGYSVTRLEDVGRAQMRDGLKEFSRAAAAAEVAIVFYAGHGIEVDGSNFLVPVDAALANDMDVEWEAIPLDLVSRSVERASGLRLIVLDACRDNPFAAKMRRSGATRSVGRGLARMQLAHQGLLVAYAAAEGDVASDGSGRNSPYSKALLEHLETPGLEVRVLFGRVRDAVMATTKSGQQPYTYGSLSGDEMYLAAARVAEPEPPPLVQPQQTGHVSTLRDKARWAVEEEFWALIKDSDDPLDFEEYLEHYPNGVYAPLARMRLKRLQREVDLPTHPVAAAPESVELSLELKRSERRGIQRVLASLGFALGPADGLFGPRTRLAIGAYQKEKGLEATGYLTAEQAEALLELWADETRRADNAAFAQASSAGTLESIVAYLKAFPDGLNAAQARKLRARLKRTEEETRQTQADKEAEAMRVAERAADDEAFARADSAGTLESYEAYLRSRPDGRHAEQARRWVSKLRIEARLAAKEALRKKAEREARERRADDARYAVAKSLNTIEAFLAYLESFPEGRHAAAARAQIAALQPRLTKPKEAEWKTIHKRRVWKSKNEYWSIEVKAVGNLLEATLRHKHALGELRCTSPIDNGGNISALCVGIVGNWAPRKLEGRFPNLRMFNPGGGSAGGASFVFDISGVRS